MIDSTATFVVEVTADQNGFALQINQHSQTRRIRMKKTCLLLVMAVATLMVAPVHASPQTSINQIKEINRKALVLSTEGDALKAEVAALKAEKEDLVKMGDTYKEAVRVFNEKSDRLGADISSWEYELAQRSSESQKHNSWRPDPYDHAAVDAYNAEAERLNNWLSRLTDQESSLKARAEDEVFVRKGLESAGRKYDASVMEWAAKQKSINDKLDKFQAKIESMESQLVKPCTELLANRKTKDEALKLGCGNVQFDNADPNLPPLPL